MNYLRLLFILTLFFNVSNCSKPEIDYYEKIQGDWGMIDTMENSSNELSFEDSLCLFSGYMWHYSKFKIHEDTLTIVDEEFDSVSYQILSISDTTLTLLFNEKKPPVKLQKIKPKSQIQFNRIAFRSGLCYGRCPKMNFELDSIGNFYLINSSLDENHGNFQGKLSKKEMDFIQSKINNVDWENIESYYETYSSHGHDRSIRLITNDKTYETKVYRYNDLPIELLILLSKLIDLPNRVTLTPNEDVLTQFRYIDFCLLPPPPPKD